MDVIDKKTTNTQNVSTEGIDIVIIWVDGSDPAWQKQKNEYSDSKKSEADLDDDAHRFRDWNNLQFLFRSIETFTPWVRKVHFVTSGHIPSWLNLDAEKLNFVKHEDYMPAEYLPTFNSGAIELNLHRIKGLSEKFIFFNDDMFITKPMNEADFFKNGLPRDMALLNRIASKDPADMFPHLLLNNTAALNKNFAMRTSLRKNPTKWISPDYKLTSLIKSMLLMHYPELPGIHWAHLPSPFLKSVFFEVWNKEAELMHETSTHKFRDIHDVNQYIVKGWQMLSGKFYPTDFYKKSRNFYNPSKQKKELDEAIRQQKYQMICINDTEECLDFEETRDGLIESFEAILPNKSSFEL